MADVPNLGYGNTKEASLDQVNQWLRSTPDYQSLLQSWGQDPGHPHDLSDDQKQQIIRLAQSKGVVVDEGHNGQEIDDNGNFRAKGHKLRNGLIIAGIAAAAIAAPYAIGAIAGAGGGAAGGAAATGLGTGVGLEGAGAGLAGVEGLGFGLGDAALAGLGSAGAGGAAATGAGASLAGLASTTLPTSTAAALPGLESTGVGMGDLGTNIMGGASTYGEPAVDAGGYGSKLASLANNAKTITNGISSVFNNGQDPALSGNAAANAANQAAVNRIRGAQVDQGGPQADKTALGNIRQSGLIRNFQDVGPSEYGNPGIKLGDQTRTAAGMLQDELTKRLAMGKSPTASGVPDPTAQELADEAKARDIANGGSGIPGRTGSIINGINTGARIAGLAPTIWNSGKRIWDLVS